MFIGHFAIGIGVKASNPKLSLGTLFVASQFLDLIWPVLVMIGIEKVKIVPGISEYAALDFQYYPYSHSFIFAVLWSIIFGGIYYLIKRDIKNSMIIGACVMSHWMLDLIVHIPDLPIFPGIDTKIGLGLWQSKTWTIIIESGIYIIAILTYIRFKFSLHKSVTLGFYLLTASLYLIFLFNSFGPVPDKVQDIAIGAQSQWIFIVWAYWIDRSQSKSEKSD